MNEESIEMSAADTRRHLAEVLNAASARGRITYITSRGRRVAAVVPLAVAEAAEVAGKDGKDAPR
ncbi:type II toxin-antitoxin system prevent-host-death family antitoxin [Streptomyces sp. NPDC058985]|uniref:type II toxin-antitoxin system prevent-host-death family antitoxin n=1 Tax=Streptomyces sp. NPDC058985 TaxID=3346684 RepID=UPI003686052D